MKLTREKILTFIRKMAIDILRNICKYLKQFNQLTQDEELHISNLLNTLSSSDQTEQIENLTKERDYYKGEFESFETNEQLEQERDYFKAELERCNQRLTFFTKTGQVKNYYKDLGVSVYTYRKHHNKGITDVFEFRRNGEIYLVFDCVLPNDKEYVFLDRSSPEFFHLAFKFIIEYYTYFNPIIKSKRHIVTPSREYRDLQQPTDEEGGQRLVSREFNMTQLVQNPDYYTKSFQDMRQMLQDMNVDAMVTNFFNSPSAYDPEQNPFHLLYNTSNLEELIT